MPRIRWQDIIDDDVDLPTFESIRTNSDPVNGKHDMQRRSENAINRFRKLDNRRDDD